MTDQIKAEWHVSEVNNPIGCMTITYIENGHAIRVNRFQPKDPDQLEAEVLRDWPHQQFEQIHASGVAPHPVYAPMIGVRRTVENLVRPGPAPVAVPSGPISGNVEEM